MSPRCPEIARRCPEIPPQMSGNHTRCLPRLRGSRCPLMQPANLQRIWLANTHLLWREKTQGRVWSLDKTWEGWAATEGCQHRLFWSHHCTGVLLGVASWQWLYSSQYRHSLFVCRWLWPVTPTSTLGHHSTVTSRECSKMTMV